MLPTSILAFLSFVLELCSASPVYNMQPAFITTHIGTTGRNIRNLPCVSRKTNEKGICMFAINCLKANGTHLGTCIDKFYFGSCCHIPPVSDIENTIDTDIIPSREPPHRLSTLKPVITTLMHEGSSTTISKTTIRTSNISSSTTSKLTSTTTSELTSTITTSKPTTTSTKEEKTTTESKISTTFNVQNFSKLPAVLESQTEEISTTAAPKLTTFLSIDGSPTNKLDATTPSIKHSTHKPAILSTKYPKPTNVTRPISKSTPKPSSRPATKPYSKPTSKPIKTTSKPKLTTTSKPAKISKPSKTTTKKPVTIKVPIATRRPTTTTKITKRPSVVTKIPTATVGVKVTTKETSTTERPVLNVTTTMKTTSASIGLISENITSNEIPTDTTSSLKPATPTVAATTEKPALITWTVDDIKRNTTMEESSSISSTTPEDWRPITTPDGWVLLPSVSSVSSGSSPTKAPVVIPTSTPKDDISSPPTNEKVSTDINVNITTQSPMMETSAATTLEEIASTSASTEELTTNETSTITQITEIPKNNTSTTESTDVLPAPVNMSDFTDVCGRRMFPEARIVGGEKSSFGKWPWQISLRQWRTSTYLHKCGAALLNENWAITAAHCVDNVPPSDLLLRLGEHDLSTESEPYLHQERRVQIVASHPQFDPRTFEYDLALLRFYEPVTFQPNIVPVCVPQSDENFVGRTAHVTGWGRLYEDGPLPSVLQEVSVPVINNSVCESMYRSAGYIEHIPHIFICAGWRRGGFDSCEGDSGGPMVIQRDDKRFLLAGVISWGIGCAEPNQPGVYTRISEFRDWINQILQF